ncbi:MAG: TatD family hydrolase [Planctomycetes bacterium]|nr:TatD family hydrolase [Planctomycetota bacterium]
MLLVDTHAHLDQEEFNEDRGEVIARALAAGVEQIVCVAVSAASSEVAISLAGQWPGIFASVGIHPNHCAQAGEGDWERVLALVGQPKVVALGETGLDRHWNYSPFEMQQDYFDRHLRLMQQTGLPIIIHTRESEADVMAMLREARSRAPLHGVMHSFVGDAAMAAECLELGMHISFAGMVTFKKSQPLRDVAATIPAERLLVETDSPYLSPHPLRGKRNEPAHVVHTLSCLAEARGCTPAELAAVTTANARLLFGLESQN